MQTFLPYDTYLKSAQCLDRLRLGKQRVEAYQILRCLTGLTSAWSNHPAVKMWRGYEGQLSHYMDTMIEEWIDRGFKNTMLRSYSWLSVEFQGRLEIPPWLGDPDFHASHRSNLLRKNPEHYSQFGWTEPDNLPYVWPVS